MPSLISFDEADARFGLRSLLPAFDDDADVTLLEPGAHAPSAIDLDGHSYVVDGSLEVQGDVCSSEEGRFLVVRGAFRVRSLLLGGPLVHVSGSLTAEQAIHTHYNHGELTVLGDVRARIIAAEHLFRVGGAIACETTIDFGGFRVSAPGFKPTLTRQQATRECREFFVPEALNSQGYVDGNALMTLLADGVDPLRRRP